MRKFQEGLFIEVFILGTFTPFNSFNAGITDKVFNPAFKKLLPASLYSPLYKFLGMLIVSFTAFFAESIIPKGLNKSVAISKLFLSPLLKRSGIL